MPTKLAANSTIIFQLTNFLNPLSTATYTGFTITTYDSVGGTIDSDSTANIWVTTSASIPNGTLTSLNTTLVQQITTLQLVFYSPLPLNAGCIIDIIFPSDFALNNANLTSIVGMNLFGASGYMQYKLDTTNNIITITDGCQSYWEPGLTGIL